MRKELCVDRMPAAQAVEALIHEYYKLVFHTIYGLTGNWEESQDLTQDTFQQALRAIDAARATSGSQFHAKAWLLRIALNTVRMQRRRLTLFRFVPFSHMQGRKQPGMDEIAATDALDEQALAAQPGGYGTPATGDPAELVAERDAVRRTLAKLPEPSRICLLLSIVGGLSMSEIARTLDLKEEAVRQRLTRARKQFKQAYLYESGEEVIDPTSATSALQSDAHTHHTGKDRAESQTLTDRPQRLSLTTHPIIMGRT